MSAAEAAAEPNASQVARAALAAAIAERASASEVREAALRVIAVEFAAPAIAAALVAQIALANALTRVSWLRSMGALPEAALAQVMLFDQPAMAWTEDREDLELDQLLLALQRDAGAMEC